MKFVCAVLLLIPAVLSAEPETVLSKEVLTPFLKDYCIKCHGPDKQKGKIRLDDKSLSISNDTQAQFWQDVLDTLNAGDMPPEKEKKRPSNEQMTATLRSLTEGLKDAKMMLSDRGKAITMRRLNRREYSATVKHLFGFTLNPDDLPADDSATFDTIGSDQYFSAYLFEKYLEYGRKLTMEAIKWNRRGRQLKPTVLKKEPEKQRIKKIRENVKKRKDRWQELALGIEAGKSWKELGFEDAREMYFYLMFDRERTGKPEAYLKHQYLHKGIYLTGQWGVRSVNVGRGFDPRASFKVRVLAGIHKQPPERRKFLRMGIDGNFIGQPRVQGTNHKPEWLEVTHTPVYGKGFNVEIGERRHKQGIVRYEHYISVVDRYGVPASIFIDSMEIDGPFYGKKNFLEKLLVDDKNRPVKLTDEFAAKVIGKFAFEALRRKVPNPEFMAGIHGIYNKSRAAGKKTEEAMAEAMAVIMASPSFLYINENSNGEAGKTELSQRELAVRLSYLLWSAPPDEMLYGLAANGKLKDQAILSSQVDRMLENPRSEVFSRAFMSQWMELPRFDLIAINNKTYPLFDLALRSAIKDEPRLFFNQLIKENLPLTNLIDSDFLVINDSLAHHYGLPSINKPGFHKVKIDKSSGRGGLMTTAAFLTMGSDGERTAPIIRGALIMDKILHDPSPSPPPNVPQLNEASKKPISVREAIELHQAKPQCASCHKKLDPIGFGLENFNAIGQWRTKEKVGRKEVDVLVDGALPNGKNYKNLQEFKQLMMGHKDDLTKSLVEGIIAYGLGRTVEFSDQDAIEEILNRVKGKNYKARELIHALVHSKLFHQK